MNYVNYWICEFGLTPSEVDRTAESILNNKKISPVTNNSVRPVPVVSKGIGSGRAGFADTPRIFLDLLGVPNMKPNGLKIGELFELFTMVNENLGNDWDQRRARAYQSIGEDLNDMIDRAFGRDSRSYMGPRDTGYYHRDGYRGRDYSRSDDYRRPSRFDYDRRFIMRATNLASNPDGEMITTDTGLYLTACLESLVEICRSHAVNIKSLNKTSKDGLFLIETN